MEFPTPARCSQNKESNQGTQEGVLKGKSIADVLDMTVSTNCRFAENRLKYCVKYRQTKVGLGYITIEQQATTLSGGEAQQVKLAEEL
jgi:excinuclease ABC subunit A